MPRPLLTGCAALASVTSALALAGLAASAVPADAAAVQPAAGAPTVTLAITSVSPSVARPGQTVHVSGTLTNTSSSTETGLTVQLRSSDSHFESRNELQQYADGDLLDDHPVGTATTIHRAVRPGATLNWRAALHVGDVPMTSFGVYPLAAEADSGSGSSLAVSRTFLPFWPGTKAQDPVKQQVAWVWPLIDQPRQGMCARGLMNNGLAASVSAGGRLSGLLEAGAQYAGSAHLTWAIDPALLANLTTMTKPYRTANPGGVGCQGTPHAGSQAAAGWLAELKSATAGQPVFVTPYSDADIAALTKNDMNADLTRDFATGRSVARQALGRDFSPSAHTSTNLGGMAWPADGVANYSVLENLAASDGIAAVVLDSGTMPPSPSVDYTPSAQTTTPDGEGTALNVLLSDDTITQILGSANSASDSPATAFSVSQRYLAETAMIAAEQPSLARSVVVAPPRRWDPPAGLASRLLQDTVTAPWLRSVSLGQLASDKHPAGQVPRQAPATTSRSELSRSLLGQVRQLDQQAGLLQSIQIPAATGRAAANGVAAVESSAWRGSGAARAQGQDLAHVIGAYLTSQEKLLKIIGQPHITLAGLKGPVPVSIDNELPYDVQVKLEVQASGGVKVQNQSRAIIVAAGQQQIKKIEISADTVGSTTLTLRLTTPGGVPLTAPITVTIQATQYGTLGLVIIVGALGILILTLGTRTFRRARRARGEGPSAHGPGDVPAGPPEAPRAAPGAGAPDREAGSVVPEDSALPEENAAPGEAAERDWPDKPGEADTVVADGFAARRDAHASDHDAAEETDDYAWAPGRTDPR